MSDIAQKKRGSNPAYRERPAPSRRRFLDYLLGTSTIVTLGAIVYPIFKFMSPPQVVESTENSVVAAKLGEVPLNSGKIFKFGNKPGILVRTSAGELKAVSAVCTHLECIVQYRPDTKQIWCACHNGQYNLNGKNIGASGLSSGEQRLIVIIWKSSR